MSSLRELQEPLMEGEAVLGNDYRDGPSGFVGQAIARAEYLYEVPQVLLVAETKQAASDSRWIPESRLETLPPGATGFGA